MCVCVCVCVCVCEREREREREGKVLNNHENLLLWLLVNLNSQNTKPIFAFVRISIFEFLFSLERCN